MYHINFDIDIPIYSQLVDMIRSDIHTGNLPYGSKLPTVRELADDCGVARGTVMKAYEELELLGLAEKIQGKGTFVSYRKGDEKSRKDKAMEAINSMLDSMEALNFSETEMQIFLSLCMRERDSGLKGVQVAIIECNNEILSQISKQISSIDDVNAYTFLLSEVRSYPYKLAENLDLIVVSAAHADELSMLMPDSSKLAKVALRIMPSSARGIVKIPEGSSIGVLCQSLRFGELAAKVCAEYSDKVLISEPIIFSDDVAAYLKDKDVLLVPKDFQRFCTESVNSAIRSFAQKHSVIQCEYQIDEGSMIYLQDRIRQIRKTKKA